MDKKQAVFYTTDSKPRKGGIADYVHGLCEGLQTLGHPVTVYSTVEGAASYKQKNYAIRPLGARPMRGVRTGDRLMPIRKWNTLRYIRSLERQALREIASAPRGGRVFITCWGFEPHFWCRACRELNVPYTLLSHGAELLDTLTPMFAAWRREDFKKAARVISITDATAALVKKIGGPEPVIVPPTVRASEFEAVETSRVADKSRELNIGPDASVLLTVARLIERKGVDLVLRALAELLKTFPDLVYVVAGDGPKKSELERLADELGVSKQVRFLGEIHDREKWLLYRLCDIFVTPNRTLGGLEFEGFGIVFLEAALASKPSVGGDNGGVPSAIVEGQTGLLVNTDNGPKPLTGALWSLLNDAKLRVQMGEAARTRALSEFGVNKVSEIFAKACLS